MLCSHWMVLVHCDRTTQEEKGAEGEVGGGAGGRGSRWKAEQVGRGAGGRRSKGEGELGEGGALGRRSR